ncbi:hypothetical protein KLP40_20700 [Hymenobacter sp. NST-14]|uniref:hypothetical protein n=1 Tax=Hymenobacter piscis TaxID=2839984 RepID=UPI001C01D064|nr:hypothetical protein [Hymenobacter piscis]MBT9395598.1 hypothetical protein [Hymenobacter piscis]
MMARKSPPTDNYPPDPRLATPQARAFAAHCLQQLVLRGQLPPEFALPATGHAAPPPRTHEGSEQDTK